MDEIDKATDGRVKVITYPGGSLLKGGEIYNGVVEGAVDIDLIVLHGLWDGFLYLLCLNNLVFPSIMLK